jgi:hypothetical protein
LTRRSAGLASPQADADRSSPTRLSDSLRASESALFLIPAL